MTKKILIYGDSDFAEQVMLTFNLNNSFEVVAFTVHSQFRAKDSFLGLPVVDFERIKEEYPPSLYSVFVAIGYSKMNKIRREVCIDCGRLGYDLVSYISPNARLYSNVTVGRNCFIADDVTLAHNSSVNDGCVILQKTYIGNGVVVGEFTYISIGVITGGYVTIGKNCFIGLGAIVKDKIELSNYTLLGSGANLVKNSDECSIYVGNPAKKIKTLMPRQSIRI